MSETLEQAILEDKLAVSLARAVAAANKKARAEGVDAKASILSSAEHRQGDEICWRVTYGPRDYIRTRGGDLIIDVGVTDGRVREFFAASRPFFQAVTRDWDQDRCRARLAHSEDYPQKFNEIGRRVAES